MVVSIEIMKTENCLIKQAMSGSYFLPPPMLVFHLLMSPVCRKNIENISKQVQKLVEKMLPNLGFSMLLC